ncbi:hypothetical protein MPER_12941 [Moniliophthora perniciosa FA553]|nr:hypothetical protein MPER_12941 [Moniliophthora perniciosa FA553]
MNGCDDKPPIAVANTQEETEKPNTRPNTRSNKKKNKSVTPDHDTPNKKSQKHDNWRSNSTVKQNTTKAVPFVELPSLSAAEKEKYVTPQHREKQAVDGNDSSEKQPKETESKEKPKQDVRGKEDEGAARKALSGVKAIDTATFKPPQPPSTFPVERVSKEQKVNQLKGDNSKRKPLDGSLYMSPEDVIAARIAKETLSMPLGDLCALQPKLVKALDRQTKNRVLAMSKMRDKANKENQSGHLSEEAVLLTAEEAAEVFINIDEIATSETYKVWTEPLGDLPAGAVVQLDPVEQFNADTIECPDGVRRVITIVASTTEGLRVVFPQVNGSSVIVEVVLDSGSQIISMDTRVAKSLELTWDPDTVIRMQSSNGGLNSTRGLARNVPFKFGEIVLYLQVHIVDNAPYQVLLGRPFDALTSSKVLNNGDDTEVELTCPNTKRRVTIPTFRRGTYKPSRHEPPQPCAEEHLQPQTEEVNFQTSTI